MRRVAGVVVALIFIVAVAQYWIAQALPSTGQATPTTGPAAPTLTPFVVPTVAFTPPAKLTAANITTIKQILTGSLNHYETLFASGQAALGTKPYPNAAAGLAALNDATSSAAKFSAWRTDVNIENDLSFMDAFAQADAYYTPEDEPHGIGNWRDDMGLATSAFDEWVQVAVSWQISEVTTATLTAASAKVKAAFKVAQQDIADTVAGR